MPPMGTGEHASLSAVIAAAAEQAEVLAEAATIRRGIDPGSRAKRKQLRVDLALLLGGVGDAVQHVALLVGYRDGYRARTEVRDSLATQVPRLDASSPTDTLLAAISKGARIVRGHLEELATAPPPEEVPAGHPRHPGPRATAERAQAHLTSLVARLEILVGHYGTRH